jgi:hypothetical protein
MLNTGRQLDTRKVFLPPSCVNDKKTLERILKVLDDYKVPKNNIFLEIDMNILNSGDYIIHYFDGVVHLFEVQLSSLFGFTTNFVGKI